MANSRRPAHMRAASRKKKNGQYHPLPKAVACMVAACFAADAALANPTGHVTRAGAVSYNENGGTLTITNTPGSIIDWQSFSVGVGELTQFIQQSASSAVLNRVVGVDPSQILGMLQSNGRVFLINPNGILFGAGAQINVAGLVASTLNISNEDFQAGKLNFTAGAGAGSVVNQGAINAGSVYLIAPDVQNAGVITSPQGEVILAAGHSVELVDAGTPNLRVEVAASDEQAMNLGQIIADSGKIGIYAGLIKNSGTLQANGVVNEGGRILLKAVNSTTLDSGSKITATGTHGGTVQVLGDTVTVKSGATIDASGTNGGGTILVGGDEHGANPDVQNAKYTTVESGANLAADATDNGDGGKVIVWSDDTTKFDGHISAKGGPDGGNGGFAEVSGKQNLYLTGHADLSAAHGAFGTLLLDPGTVHIKHNDGGESGPDVFDDTYINSQLGSSSLTIRTSDASGAEGATEDINFDSNVNISWSNATALTFNAGHDINYDGQINATNSGASVNFTAGNSIAVDGTINAPTIAMNAGNAIIVNQGVTASSTGDASVTMTAGAGGITVDGGEGGGYVEAYGGDGSEGGAGHNATISLSASGGIGIFDTDVYAEAGGGSGSGNGGVATISLNGGAGGITLDDSPVEADGGSSDSGTGGAGTVNLSAVGGTLDAFDDVYAYGGEGAVGGSGTLNINVGTLNMEDASFYVYGGEGLNGNGGGASITLTAGAGGISLQNDSGVGAYGGDGDGGTGGAGTVNLSAAGGILTIANDSGVYAHGGEGDGGNGGDATINANVGGLVLGDGGEGYAQIEAFGGEDAGLGSTSGGAATITLNSAGGISINGGDGSEGAGYVIAEGGDGENGGAASINLNGGSGGISIVGEGEEDENGYVEATGGEGFNGNGGAASIVLNTSGALNITENIDYALYATGGVGENGNGGDAAVIVGNVTPPSSITLTTMGIEADGGEGSVNGGNATVSLASTGAFSVLGDSYIAAAGGEGSSGSGGSASTTLTGNGITLQDVFQVFAGGGEGGTVGGGAEVFLNSGGAVSISNSGVIAEGGDGDSGAGGAGTVGILAAGNITDFSGGEFASINASGGDAFNGNGGNASVYLVSTNGNILIDGDDVAAYAGDANDSGFVGGNGVAAVVASHGDVTVQNGGYIEADGGYGSDPGSGGKAVAALNASGNVLFQNDDSYIGAYGGADGAEGYANAQTLIGFPLLDNTLFPLLSGTVLPTPASVTFNNDAGDYAYGTGSSVYIGTIGSLNIANGSYVEANSPLENDGSVLIDASDVNVSGGDGVFDYSYIYAGAQVSMIVEGGTVHIDAGGGEGAYAEIATGSPDTIFVHFFGSLTSGGYFVNGQEGTIYDAATNSGFVVDGEAAILNENLFIDYTNEPSGLPPDVTAALNHIIAEINQHKNDTNNNEDQESDDDKKKNSCS